MNHADEMATERHLASAAPGSVESDQRLRALLENLERVSHRENAVEQDDHHFGITHGETSEPEDYHRPLPIENEKRRRGSFARYFVAILIGVAAALAWQSYGDAAKQMIASWVQQLGWTKPLTGSEKQAAPVAQTAPETVVPKAPAVPSIDPAQVQQIAGDLATLQQTVEQLAAGLDQVTRQFARLEAADVEILAKITPAPPPPRPIAAPARKPTPTGSGESVS